MPEPKPWEGLDPEAPGKITFNLRLNAYQRALLEYVADKSHRSMQQQAMLILMYSLEDFVNGPEEPT